MERDTADSHDGWDTTTMTAEAADIRRLAEARVYLLVFEGESSRMVPLAAEGDVTIGRGESVEVRIVDGSVSRKHARLTLTAGQGVITDLDSQNGTKVNGERITGGRPLVSGMRTPIQAELLSGTWDTHIGYQGAGGKISNSSGFSIACRGVGAVAKCLDMGYKPWKNATQDSLHQACVRMVRADYCGDGNSFTTTGHPIDVTDIYWNTQTPIQQLTPNSGLYFEAGWNVNGSYYVDHTRNQVAVSAYDGNMHLGTWQQAHSSYCYLQDPWDGPGHASPGDAGGHNLLTDSSTWNY